MQEMWVWSLGQEDPLEKGMATHSSIHAWKILWTEEPGRLQSKMSQRIGHNRVTKHTQTQFSDWGGGCPLYCRMFSITGGRWPTRCQYFLPPQVMIIQMLPDIASVPRGQRWVSSVQFSRSVVSDSLWPHESQHARPPCPSPTPGVHSDSRPSSQWCQRWVGCQNWP